jgi:uncharacterized protein YndB with AHSA1/START domain
MLTLPSDTEILVTREFAAPRALVWRAWTTPELVSQWWPGRRGRMVSCAIDLRVGATWRYAMTTHEGFEVAFHGSYQEIEPESRIVNTEIYEGVPGGSPPVTVITTFTEDEGRTTMSMLTVVESRELRDMIVGSGMESGLNEGMEILEELVTEGDRANAGS